MNICVVAYKFGTEQEIGAHLGTYHYFIEKMRHTARQGHTVAVVCPWLSFFKRGSSRVDGVTVVRFWPPLLNVFWLWPLNRFLRQLFLRRTQRAVRMLLRRMRCDAVYVWQARESGFAVAQIKEELRVPFIFRQITAWKWHFDRPVHEVYGTRGWYRWCRRLGISLLIDTVLAFLLERNTQQKYARTIYDKADRAVFLSQAAVREAQEFGLNPKKAAVIGVAIEEDIFKPTSELQSVLRDELGIPHAPTLLFIGRVNFAEKGVGVLLESCARVLTQVPHAQLLIVGSGEIDRLKAEAEQLKITPHIRLLGKRSFHELPRLINAADICVVPSLWMEAFGQVTIEAMSCAVPVVTSDAGASPEINIDGETGFVTPAGDAHALAQAMVRLLLDDGLRKRMGEAARKRVREQYTYDSMVKRFIGIISSVVGSREKSQ